MGKRWLWRAPKILAIFIVGAAILTYVVMMLWNWLIPDLFAGPILTFWQTLGLLVLCRILFGGMRGGRGMRGRHWRQRMRERWQRMTPEEREKFRQGVRKGMSPSEASDPPERPAA